MVCCVSKGTNGLWSVSTDIALPIMKLLRRLQAQVTDKASFSICEYFDSVDVMDLDM